MKKIVLISLLVFSLSVIGKAQNTTPVKYDYLLVTIDEIGTDNSLTILKTDGTSEDLPLASISGVKPQENFDENNATIINALKNLGEQGWELVSISDVSVQNTRANFSRYVFKKIK
jgi:hypothetical protein